MLMMLAVLGTRSYHLSNAADADDAQCFQRPGSDQMARRCAADAEMFAGCSSLAADPADCSMMRSAWDQIGRSSEIASPLIQLMLMMRGASDSIARS